MSRLKLFKRVGITSLTLIMVGGLLAGCKGSSNASSSASTEGKVKEISLMTANSPDKDYFKKLGDEFTKLHPDIKVKLIQVPQDQFDSKLQTMIASKTEPDITTHVQSMSFKDFYTAGLLTDLTPYMKKYGYDPAKYGIDPNNMKMVQVDGKTYGIPLNTYVSLMLYNKDLFDKAGIAYPPTSYEDKSWTYDKMIEIAKKLTVPSSDPTKAQYGLTWVWDGAAAENMPIYYGQSLFDEETLKTGYGKTNNLNTPELIGVFDKVADLTFKDKVSPPQSFIKGLGGSDPFLSGKIAMMVEGAWGLSGTNDVKFKVGVAAIPSGWNDKVRSLLYTDPYVVFKSSKNPEGAFQFIQFLAEKESQDKMVSISGGNPPANTNSLDTYCSFFKSVDPQSMKDVINGALKYGTEDLEHVVVGSGQITSLLTSELEPLYFGTKSSKDICPDLSKKLTNVMTKIDSK